MLQIGEIVMPSTYAHYRLGQEVLGQLPDEIRATINSYKQLYDIGLHGPDILFYYKPLWSCPVNKQGYDMHGRSGREFFEKAAKVISGLDAGDERAALSYLYGFCCHFALDVSCHGYIDEKIAASGVSHTEIEVEFDRSLMIKDGFNPITHSLTDHINPTHENAETIKKFYNNLTTDEVVQALKGMIKYNKLLIAPSHLKRYLIYALLGVTGNYKEMHGLLVSYKANRQCDDSTERLYKLYDNALDLAVRLIGEYKDSARGSLPLNKIYRYTFGGKCTQNAEGNVDENVVVVDREAISL